MPVQIGKPWRHRQHGAVGELGVLGNLDLPYGVIAGNNTEPDVGKTASRISGDALRRIDQFVIAVP